MVSEFDFDRLLELRCLLVNATDIGEHEKRELAELVLNTVCSDLEPFIKMGRKAP